MEEQNGGCGHQGKKDQMELGRTRGQNAHGQMGLRHDGVSQDKENETEDARGAEMVARTYNNGCAMDESGSRQR